MRYFDTFSSCTAAGSGSQNWFAPEDSDAAITCRVYYRLSRDVRKCALLYSNLIDSTYADGSHSHVNFVPGEWAIHALRAGVVRDCAIERCTEPESFISVGFDGQLTKNVHPGEIFSNDAFELCARKGEYLCLEMAFSGARVPCHTESLLPAFRLVEGRWEHCTDMPFPSMIGGPRGEAMRLGFIGDSITQGIGTRPNVYEHLAVYVQEALAESCDVWNLGLGYGRAHDAALDGGWLYKARQNDVMCVCYGVNDLFQIGDAEQLKRDLTSIVRKLRQSGLKVLIQTVPPFDYAPEYRERWMDVNNYIQRELSREADALFDTVPVLCKNPEEPWTSRYGAHPDGDGNAAWAKALIPVIGTLLPGLG